VTPDLEPLYVIPLLIEQPTWGGGYIADFKRLSHHQLAGLKIGQSYELASDSLLTSSAASAVSLATASTTNQPTALDHPERVTTMAELVASNPAGVLGPAAAGRPQMPLLIKFTQAQNNSYQLHVKPSEEVGNWQPKPESWYFLEPGAATLGLRPDCDLTAYRQRCKQIEAKAEKLSQAVKQQRLSAAQARQLLGEFIDADHPGRFVNRLRLEAGSIIDLSGGGIHHSWESSAELPAGNIVYELQLDVRDDVSTLRSFDQGKMKDDGSVRRLTIDEYFAAIDSSPSQNLPETHMRTGQVRTDGNATISHLFDTPQYQLYKIALNGSYQSRLTVTEKSFHHLFVAHGEVVVTTPRGEFPLRSGWSLFVPSAVGQYSLAGHQPSQVLLSTA